MKACERQASGVVELWLYDELAPAARSSIASHVAGCEECRRALEELSLIRDALAARPQVAAPLDGDWSGFMIRLDESIRMESGRDQPARVADTRADVVAMPARSTTPGVSRFAPYVALAAVLTLVTSGIVYLSRHVTPREEISRPTVAERATPTDAHPAEPSVQSVSAATGFTALSEQHFERSKLVVFGLANKDPKQTDGADWAYERGLASSLLDDTRLYRMAAEERGMKTLAGVMGDLEIVLLQTSLADSPDPDALVRIQRLIHKRDLVTKMEVAGNMGS